MRFFQLDVGEGGGVIVVYALVVAGEFGSDNFMFFGQGENNSRTINEDTERIDLVDGAKFIKAFLD